MQEQCTLLPQILDPCCGGRMFYFDKHDPRIQGGRDHPL